MSFGVRYTGTSGLTLTFRIRKLDANSLATDYWNDVTAAFEASEPAASADRISMTEESTYGVYEGASSANLGTYTGGVNVQVFSAGVSIVGDDFYVQQGLPADFPVQLTATIQNAPFIWAARLGGTSLTILEPDASSTGPFIMDFGHELAKLGLSINEDVAATVVDQSSNSLSVPTVQVSLDRTQVHFYTGALTAGLTYQMKVSTTLTDGQVFRSTGLLKPR